jgi:hypothetical protein
MAALPDVLDISHCGMPACPRHRQALQITVTPGHVDNPARGVKFRRHNKSAASEIASEIQENEDGGR